MMMRRGLAVSCRPPGAAYVLVLGVLAFFAASCGADDDLFASEEWGTPEWEVRTPLGVEFGGSVAITSDDRILVNRESYGLLRSDDGGGSWVPAGLEDAKVYRLAVGESTNFAGTVYSTAVRGWPGGLYRSTDSGSTWELVGFDEQSITALAAAGSQVYAGVSGPRHQATLYRSEDFGDTWTEVLGHLQHVSSISIAETAVFVVVGIEYERLLLRSTDGDGPWRTVVSEDASRASALGTHVICRLGSSVSQRMVYSVDLGDTWFEVEGLRSGSDTLVLDSAVYDALGDSVARWRLVGSPNDARRSSALDRAKAWERAYLDLGIPELDISVLASSDTYLYVIGEDGQVFRARRPV